MAKTAELKVRLEPQLKRKAAAVYRNWGFNLCDTVTVILSQSVIEGGLPFRMDKIERPNAHLERGLIDACDQRYRTGEKRYPEACETG